VKRRAAVLIVGLAVLAAAVWLGWTHSAAVYDWYERVLGGGASGRHRPARPSPQAPDLPEQWTAAEPAGPFSEATSDAVLGWRWTSDDDNVHWRAALLLQPPCRVTGRAVVPAGGVLRFFALLRWIGPEPPQETVLVRCTARDATGEAVGACSRVLHLDATGPPLDRWTALVLPVTGAAGSAVTLTLETGPEDPDGPVTSLPMLAVAAHPAAPAATSGTPGPNCVIILVDTLRADRLHCYGHPLETSPHIDELAEQGTVFERVTSASSWTVPSVASLFTGTYVSTHGVPLFRTASRLPLPALAEHFRTVGARTAAVSANAFIIPAGGFGAGFDEFVTAPELTRNGTRATWVTEGAIALLRRLNGQRFFLYLHYMDPHDPYQPPPAWQVFGQTDEQRYFGEIRYCDSEIGRFLDELDALGRTRDTLVVFIADHGEAFMEHGFRHHGFTVHREEVHVPLILRYPGRIAAGRRVPSLVRSIDVHTTIADLMGLDIPRHVEGESLVPQAAARPASDRPRTGGRAASLRLGGSGSKSGTRAFSELHQRGVETAPGHCVSCEDERYKLILLLEQDRRLLYDVLRDPDEQTDLAAQQPDRAAAMERTIRQFLKERKGLQATSRPMTPAEERRLRALGYLDPGEKPRSERPKP